MGHIGSRSVGLLAGVFCVGGLALGGANWVGQPYSLSIPTHIAASGQTVNGSLLLTLQHDVSCSVVISVAQPGNQVLKRGGQSLVTAYKLTGAALSDGDADYLASDAFIARTYHLPGTGPSDALTLWVQGTAPSGQALDAGAYTSTIVMTVTW